MIQGANRLNTVEEYYFSRKLREVNLLIESGKPVINLGTENSVFITRAILLICGILPEPIAVIIIKNANKIATHFIFKACSM